jgi:hypothetical protein
MVMPVGKDKSVIQIEWSDDRKNPKRDEGD